MTMEIKKINEHEIEKQENATIFTIRNAINFHHNETKHKFY